ncbi:hypothetical protein Trihar35433_7746 [Trichoderma harzianum]|nr:hypothetical protein Trihar35433_7746 [Trichoderma harzianum]
MSPLRADVFTTPSIPFAIPGGKPGQQSYWSPTTATLISGEREAILVDTLWTVQQANNLADWIERTIPGKRLTTVYITHGHGDHFLGLKTLRKRFPGFQTLATPRVIAQMKKELEPKYFQRAWGSLFPNQIDHDSVLPEELGDSNTLSLEGHVLQVHEAGDSDTTDTTFLHIPDLNLIVAGDIVYNDVHPFLGEAATPERRRSWLACLEKIAKLNPHTVIAGHKRDGAVDGSNNVQATIEYIETFEIMLLQTKDAIELFQRMSEKYPTRINPQALTVSCRNAWSAKKKAEKTVTKL